MKKQIILFFLMLIYFACFSLQAESSTKNDNQLSSQENYFYEDNISLIYGNMGLINDSLMIDINEKIPESKFVLVYDLNKYNKTKLSSESYDNFAIAYYKKNGILYTKTYMTNETNISQKIKDLSAFFGTFISDLNIKTTNLHNIQINQTNEFRKVEERSGECVVKPYGKIVYTSNVYMSEVHPDFNVYMVETSTEFIPGHALRNLGDNTYDSWDSEEAYQKTMIFKVTRTYYGYPTYGEEPNVLEYWPKNEPVVRTICTSLGAGLELGVSQKDGFVGTITGNFGYSQSYTDTDPTMSASTLLIGKQYGWYFDFSNWYSKTFHFKSGEMVEMENGSYLGQFSVEHDFWFQVDKLWGTNKYITYKPSFTVYAYD